MQGLSSSYEFYLQVITVNKDEKDCKLVDFKNSLIQEEKRRFEKKIKNNGEELKIMK